VKAREFVVVCVRSAGIRRSGGDELGALEERQARRLLGGVAATDGKWRAQKEASTHKRTDVGVHAADRRVGNRGRLRDERTGLRQLGWFGMVDGCHRGGRFDTLTTLQSSLDMMFTPVRAALVDTATSAWRASMVCGEGRWVACRDAPSLYAGCTVLAASFYNKVAPSTLDRLAPRSKTDNGKSTRDRHASPLDVSTSQLGRLSAARMLRGQRPSARGGG
jgi:hypothetical protein